MSGVTAVVTRAAAQNRELAELLAERGARVIEMPLIAIEEPEDSGRERDEVLQRLETFDWIVVTSPNGAERVAPFLEAAVAADDTMPLPRIAVVGEATERTLGRRADLVASPARGAVLVGQFPDRRDGASSQVLVVQGDLADDTVVDGLAAKGWSVSRVVAYRTVQLHPGAGAGDEVRSADVLFLASGSAASAWYGAFGATTPSTVITIGPSTTAVARRLGLEVSATADEPTVVAMVETAERIIAGE